MPFDSQRLLKYSGFVGLGMIVLGGFLYWRHRKAQGQGLFGLGLGSYRPGRFEEAPVVESHRFGNMQTELRESADMPIEQRIASIQKMIEKGVMDPNMTKLAMKITAHCPERDGKCEAKAIYKYVKKHMRYTGDVAPIKRSNGSVEGIDRYATPQRSLEFGGGDCDDQVAVVATLGSSIGLVTRLRVTAQPGEDDYSHIYPIIGLPKFAPTQFVAVDTTLPGMSKFGVEYPSARQMDFDA
jgi:hypothetical protein